jgi:hypothetical protein
LTPLKNGYAAAQNLSSDRMPASGKDVIPPASKQVKGRHSGLDPESRTVMDYEH